ncbi:MAG TPA: zinc metallopeptidase [Thermoanaerobacterales bacterium]|nr:zinc metallopeptidase [Thermoanaerobacterales bacterium]
MPLLFGDYTFIIVLPALMLAMYAQAKVNGTFQKYLRVSASSGLTGAQVARRILDNNGLHDVHIEMVRGNLTDHYDPRSRILRLSHQVYSGGSIAALGVAAHEAGHAMQHNLGYIPLGIRNAIFPVANIGSRMAFPLFFVGLIFRAEPLLLIGIAAFTAAVLFHIVTLPVELDASNRAIAALQAGQYVTTGEVKHAKQVLSAAALTYIAATFVAITQLLRLLMLSGMFRKRN